jgi:hypothetical protein
MQFVADLPLLFDILLLDLSSLVPLFPFSHESI